MDEECPMIELYAQYSWHSAGGIRLNHAGAIALMAGLQAFIDGQPAVVKVFASDGEGYSLHLVEGGLHDDCSLNHYLHDYGAVTNSGESLAYSAHQVIAAKVTE
jgi:hypothetical protein